MTQMVTDVTEAQSILRPLAHPLHTLVSCICGLTHTKQKYYGATRFSFTGNRSIERVLSVASVTICVIGVSLRDSVARQHASLAGTRRINSARL